MGCRLTVSVSLKRIGSGALDYDFGALDNADNPFTKSYMNLVYDRLLSVSSVVRGSRRANRLPYSSASPLSGTPLDRSLSSCPSRDGSPGCSHGYLIIPATMEWINSDRTRSRRASSLGN